LKFKKKLYNLSLLTILLINFTVTGLVLGDNILNNLKHSEFKENSTKNVSSIQTNLENSGTIIKQPSPREKDLINIDSTGNQLDTRPGYSSFQVQQWDNASFAYRKDITIDNTKVSGSTNLVNFPLLLELYDIDLRNKVQSDADDIIFTDESGIKLDHELEEFNQAYNSTHAHLITWIRIPSLYATVDTQIRMYYGNTTLNSNENAIGVWNSNYKGVWHLSEDPSGTSPQMLDSTSNNYDGTTSGIMTSDDQINGQISGSIDFDGIDDYITTNYAGVTGSNARTVSFWINTNNLEDRDIISYGNFDDNRFIIRIDESNTVGDWVIRLEMKDATTLREQRWSTHLTDGNWHYVSVIIPQDVNINQTLCFVDGQLESVDATFGSGTASSGSGGANNFQVAYTLNKNGLMGSLDEIRISDTMHSADWIATEFNNQFNPSSFFTFNLEEMRWFYPEYLYRKSINIDNTKVSGSAPLSDFPALIDLYDIDLQNKAQSDGDDIIFTDDSGTQLDHEIEVFNQTFNNSHAHLVAWVRIPSLSATEDTPIKIYYGNSTVSSQENVEGVWDSNFKLVHHLEENPTGTIYDSTSNNNDATSYGTMTTNNQVSGIIDGALDFDGSDDYISWTTAFSSTTGTYSWWMYPHSVTGERNYIADDAYRRRISLWDDVVKIETNTEAEYFDFDQSSISANIWTQVVFVRSGNSGDLYVNGSWVQQKTVGGADTLTVSAIGGTVDNTRMVDGLIDEVRISNVTRSADWISTEYINQFDSTNFYSIGSEESQLIWPHTDYQYRKSITIEKTKVSGSSDLADFPILLDIYDTDLRKKAHPDGNDIIFTGDFGVKLDHEIEVFNQTFNNSHAHLVAWVRVPSLSGLSDTKIEMYYGNYSVSQQENPKGVWDSNSVAVWHLNDNFLDSTVNSNDGTNSGSIDKTGYIANGQDFDGNDDYIDVGSGNSVDNVFIGGGTVSAWIYPTGWGESLFGRIVDKSTDTLGADGWGFIVNGGGVIKNKITFYRDFSTERGFWYSPTDSLSLNQWQHVVVTYNEDSTSNEPILYINGVSQTILWDDLPIGTPSDDSAQSLHIGKFAGANSRNFDGIIDELHISTIERSADWIITEYNNQLDPASFYLISSEEAQTSWPQSDFRYRKQITINNNQVNSPVPLTNFPFMVNISDTDLRDKTQPDGDDIIFTDITGMKLDHEIEYFDQQYTSSFAHLVAWVRIPVLHATIDTDLYMYYGNLTINSQENPTGVWDSNYKGVWHLSEDPTSTAPQFIDSTTNNNHGTASNLVSSDQITGQIDGALNFTDSDQDYINIGDQSSLNMGSGDFTLELWFNYDGTNKGPLAGKGSYGTNGIRYYLAIETTGGVIKAEIDTNVGGKREVQSASTYADSLWPEIH
jgi:hypothetical protein